MWLRTQSLLSLALAGFSSMSGSEYRIFTDSQGREISAKLLRVSSEDIYIEREDGLKAKVPLSKFSDSDQRYVKDWAQMELLRSGAVKVRFATDRSDKKVF